MQRNEQTDLALDERYELGELLADTDNSVLLKGYDLFNSRDVCIKLLKRSAAEADPEAIHRFRREALTLSEIDNKNVVEVYEFGSLGGGPGFVMEMVQGRPLSDVARQGELELLTILKIIRNIAEGLAHVHRLGIIHRDIKPANILLVDEVSAEIRIIDFGYAALRSRSAQDDEALIGTLRYMAPEQAGLICRPVGERADLYSLGCVAYELLAGLPPFVSNRTEELLRSIQTEQPTALRSFAPEVPIVLERIINKLLEKNPDDRYRSVESLLFDLERLLTELSSKRAAPIFEPDASEHVSTKRIGTVMVGRRDELATINHFTEDLGEGRPKMVLVSGLSGSGKSTFVVQCINQMMLKGAKSVRGKCYSVSSRTPWCALTDLLTDLHALYSRLPVAERKSIASSLSEKLGDAKAHLLRAAPEWVQELGAAEGAPYEGADKDAERAFHMLTTVLGAFATSDAPLVVFLDDLQWADDSSIRLLQRIVKNGKQLPVFFLCAYRSDEVDAQDSVQELITSSQSQDRRIALIEIAALTKGEVAELIGTWLDMEVPAGLAELVHERSGGNAFFVWEVLRAFQNAGVFSDDGQTREVNFQALENIELPSNLLDVLLARLRRLPNNTQQVLGTGATYGQAFSFSLLCACSDLDEQAVYEALAAAEDAGVVSLQLDERGHVYAFEHDKILAACEQFVSDAARPRVHRRIGGWLERRSKESDETSDELLANLAFHYSKSGVLDKALPFLSRAAPRAKETMQNDEALRLFAQLEGLMDANKVAPKDSSRIEAMLAHAEVQDRVGNYDEAETLYGALLGRFDDDLGVAKVQAKYAYLKQKRGRVQEAQASFVAALRLLEVETIVDQEKLDWKEERASLEQEARELLDRREDPTVLKRLPNEREKLIAELWTRLWYTHSFHDVGEDNEKMYYLAYKLLHFVAPFGESSELSVSHRIMSITLCQGSHPDFEQAVRHAFKSVEVARRTDAPMAIAVGYIYIGCVITWESRYEDAIGYLEQGKTMLERIGNQWDLVNAHIFLMMCKRALGRIEAALGHALEIVRVAERAQAAGSMASGYWKVADLMALRGESDLGEVYLEKAISIAEEHELKFDLYNALKIRAQHRMHDGKLAEARADLERAMEFLESNHFMRAYIYDCHIGLAETCVLEAQGLEGAEREQKLTRADKLLEVAIDMEKRYRNHLPYGYRILARLHAARGNMSAARNALNEAERIVVRDGRLLERPMVLELEADLLMADEHGEQAKHLYAQARDLWTAFGSPNHAARLQNVLDQIGGTSPHEEALATVKRQSEALLDVALASSGLKAPDEQARSILDTLIDVCHADRGFLFFID